MIKSCLTAFSICLSEESWKYKITSARNLEVKWVWEPSERNLLQLNIAHVSTAKNRHCTFLPELFLTSLEVIQVWISRKQFCKCERDSLHSGSKDRCTWVSFVQLWKSTAWSSLIPQWNSLSVKCSFFQRWWKPARQIKVKPSKYIHTHFPFLLLQKISWP